MQDVIERASKIRLVIFDIDGVLTDGRLFFDEHGQEYKSFHVHDGHGIKLLQENGIQVAVISGRGGKSVEQRLNGLGIQHQFLKQQDKREALKKLCDELHLNPAEVAHVGDDLPDLPLITMVGLGIAVKNAHSSLNRYAHWQTRLSGGQGAAREVCDLILQAQGKLDSIIEGYAGAPL